MTSGIATAETVIGTVVGIADGDTLTVLDEHFRQHKIRLAGINAPEKPQDFGNRSKQSLSELAYRQPAAVETDKTDRHGRRVGKVIVNGRGPGAGAPRHGMALQGLRARAAPGRPPSLAEAEDVAKAAGRGLWSMPGPVPPWEFRRPVKTAAVGLSVPSEVDVQLTTDAVP
jgi:endonuclease YncB( thermonuclease family)